MDSVDVDYAAGVLWEVFMNIFIMLCSFSHSENCHAAKGMHSKGQKFKLLLFFKDQSFTF